MTRPTCAFGGRAAAAAAGGAGFAGAGVAGVAVAGGAGACPCARIPSRAPEVRIAAIAIQRITNDERDLRSRGSVCCWLFDTINHQDLHGPFLRVQFEAKLLLQRCEN